MPKTLSHHYQFHLTNNSNYYQAKNFAFFPHKSPYIFRSSCLVHKGLQKSIDKILVEHHPHYCEKQMDHPQEICFKTCPMCKKHWGSQDAFLDDSSLVFNGYQANFGVVEQGLFYFTHETDGCGSTMALKAEVFLSLYNGKRYTESKQLSEECQRYCLDRSELRRCQAHCQYAFVREITQIILSRPHVATPSYTSPSDQV